MLANALKRITDASILVNEYIDSDMMDYSQPKPDRVAIDGPSASGKSTVGAILAERWQYRFLDTGIMYRCVTQYALAQDLDMSDERVLGQLAESLRFELSRALGGGSVLTVQGESVSDDLWTDAVTASVSMVSAVGAVRTALVRQQREIGAQCGIVMVGRDIGTVVMPDADLKVYLDASAQARATRRMLQNGNVAGSVTYDEVLAAIERRDGYDSNRSHSPLTRAADAVYINTDALTAEEAVDSIEQKCRRPVGAIR